MKLKFRSIPERLEVEVMTDDEGVLLEPMCVEHLTDLLRDLLLDTGELDYFRVDFSNVARIHQAGEIYPFSILMEVDGKLKVSEHFLYVVPDAGPDGDVLASD